jgi:hypothetical protein
VILDDDLEGAKSTIHEYGKLAIISNANHVFK